MNIAVFDFDKTLTKKHSFWRFLWYSVGTTRFLYAFFALRKTLWKYGRGQVELMDLREQVIYYFFEGIDQSTLEEKSDAFAKTVIPKMLNSYAMQRVKWHQAQGHQTIIVSNSLELYLKKWAINQGFDTVMGSILEIKNQRATGYLSGTHCIGQEKVNRLKRYLELYSSSYIYAYGDSDGDTEMLQFADKGFYRFFN